MSVQASEFPLLRRPRLMGASLSACASHCTMTWLGTCEKLSLEPPPPPPTPSPAAGVPSCCSGAVDAFGRVLEISF